MLKLGFFKLKKVQNQSHNVSNIIMLCFVLFVQIVIKTFNTDLGIIIYISTFNVSYILQELDEKLQ